jgi:hypothetical protein
MITEVNMTQTARITSAAITGLFLSASAAAADLQATAADDCVRERVRDILTEAHQRAESLSNEWLNITLDIGYTSDQLQQDFVDPCEAQTNTQSNFFSDVERLEFTLGRAKITFE